MAVCNLTVEREVVQDLLLQMDSYKSMGPDAIHLRILKKLAEVTHLDDQGKPVQIIFLDFSKAFDTLTRRILLDKMSSTQLDKYIMWWCSIFINDLDEGLDGLLSKFADDTELRGAVDSQEGSQALQRDLDKLRDWEISNHRKFNKRKCWILHLGWGNPECVYRLGNEMLESSATGRDLGVLVNGKLNMNRH
ncbi:hypothetical protein WISP_63866 [Willisornis vidua]|uniref:Reverse transcriptase domain-containing protein n=1 Tax=Willisornis vidua TaxID=1566151 RepID=A0ABQ9D9K4_9PASS|nr:hypothetical protein WISP_63866 [Willisornis vidua]